MASERSLFRKLEVLISLASAEEVGGVRELGAAIERHSPDIFYSRRYDSNSEEFVWEFSRNVLRRAIKFARTLDLIDSGGALTETGRLALRRDRYAEVIRGRVRRTLEKSGFEFARANEVIRSLLSCDPPQLPTSEVLREELGIGLGKGKFSTLLTLLGHAGGANFSQRKMYLEFFGG